MALVKDYVKVNEYTRPKLKLLAVKGIVIHWTATPNATAENERNYFNGTAIEVKRYASAHIFVDRKEARLIIPLNEVAYHANEHPTQVAKFKATASYYKGGNANLTTIGVEMCVEKDNTIHPDTIARTEQVVADLCKQYKLTEKDIYRHYDITGKNCPAPFVSDSSKFTAFKSAVKKKLGEVTAKPDKVSTASDTYKVVKGDTLSDIAVKYKMTVKDLKSLNGLKSDLIQIGQKLKVKKPATASKPKAKMVIVKVSELYTYKSANWNDKGQIVKKGQAFTIKKELTVSGSKMYQLKSGLYITANSKYVEVK